MRMPAQRHRHALLACVLVALLALAGCGGSHAATSTGKATSPGSSGSSPSAGDDTPAPDPGFEVPKAGTCTRMTAAQSRASVAPPADVSCRRQHTTVVTYVGYSTAPITPATRLATRRQLAKRLCEPAYRAWVGGTVIDRASSLLTWTFFTPSQAQLERGARWVRCDVLARSGTSLVPLPDRRPLLGGRQVPTSLKICENAAGRDVSCAGRHTYELAAVFRGAGRRYPGVTSIAARNRCRQLLGAYGGFVQYPSRQGWSDGDRFVRCLTPAGGLPSPSSSPSP